jgi:UDPglucose--hexose-1-phosphate uridylyltransferase
MAKQKFPSELRFDLVSGDWVVIATGRAKRPEMFRKEKREESRVLAKDCPFCQIETQERPTAIFSNGKMADFKPTDKIPDDWTTVSIPNKYPAFVPASQLEKRREGEFFCAVNAVGFHEVVVFRDHQKSLGQLSVKKVKEVIDVYQERYLALIKEKFVEYVAIFHNHGVEAGASISHPHSQIIATPLIDIDLQKALLNSEKCFREQCRCLYCEMGKWELKNQKRIVFENEDFFVLCPFASKAAFEMIISPKKHQSHFETIKEPQKWRFAEVLQSALAKLYKGLGDPAYNFYIHTPPHDQKKYDHYHWHLTILPKTATWAGFELGARMEISTIEPEKAAEYLRKQ